MRNELLQVSIRKQAIFITNKNEKKDISELTLNLVANVSKLGFGFSEELLHAINTKSITVKMDIFNALKEITGVNKNWTPLVRNWDITTNETRLDHIITYFSNLFNSKKGTLLQCGHIIPPNTFPLERYNGCPYCGTPFETNTLELENNSSKLKVLELWTEKDMKNHFKSLLTSKVALDATEVDSLKLMLENFEYPNNVEIAIKETTMLVIDAFIEKGEAKKAQSFYKNPNDILRYLWYKHTGFLQIVEPKTIIKRSILNQDYHFNLALNGAKIKLQEKNKLKLKYDRKTCRTVASWINNLEISADKICENMHPKRNMWVKFIRALRLAEYSKKKGFENLKVILDKFYNEDYPVWQSRVNYFRLKSDADNTFKLLKQRPGLFARSLFSNIIWFGTGETLSHFQEIVEEIPTRLLLTLSMYAKAYFRKDGFRSAKALGGVTKRIPTHQYLSLFSDEQLEQTVDAIETFCLTDLKRRYASVKTENKSIFINQNLYYTPINIGDRSNTVQDLPSKYMGQKFPVEGSKVRLFMNWGEGLKAQHLDMDLSCLVSYKESSERCSYSQLNITGCKHSGDIQSIPNMVGTSEYIEIDIDELAKKGAKMVTFTCNAYTKGVLENNMVFGWMNSKFPMKISKRTGVAYNPANVQFQARIEQNLDKGLVFGVLDIEKREIIWLEMSFQGQVVQNMNLDDVTTLLDKLNSKFSIGSLLKIMAEAQGIEITTKQEKADMVFDTKWASDMNNISLLLVD